MATSNERRSGRARMGVGLALMSLGGAAGAGCSFLTALDDLTSDAGVDGGQGGEAESGRAGDSGAASDTADEGATDSARPAADSGDAGPACDVPYALGAEEPVGVLPAPAGADAGFVWKLAAAKGVVYAGVTNDYSGGTGGIYRVAPGQPSTLMMSGFTPARRLQVVGTSLFASDNAHIVKMPVSCTAPCSAAETLAVAANDDFLADDEMTVYWVHNNGILHKASRGSIWVDTTVGNTSLTSSYLSIAATNKMLFVASNAPNSSLSLFAYPLPGRGAGTPPLLSTPPPAGGGTEGQWVVAACERVYVRTRSGRTFQVDPPTATYLPTRDAPGLVYTGVADGYAQYYGMANGGGLYRVTAGSGVGAQIAPTRSVWGVAMDSDFLYYGEHGDGVSPAAIYRKRKLY